MRLQRERPPDALHRGGRDARRLRHVAGAPVRRARRLLLKRLDHDSFDLVVADLARRAASGFVAETVEAVLCEPLSPRAHGLARDADLGGDCAVVEPIGGEQKDLPALRIAPPHPSPPHETGQISALITPSGVAPALLSPPQPPPGPPA